MGRLRVVSDEEVDVSDVRSMGSDIVDRREADDEVLEVRSGEEERGLLRGIERDNEVGVVVVDSAETKKEEVSGAGLMGLWVSAFPQKRR